MDHRVDILVVDDDPDILTLVAGVLTDLGLSVATATDGRQGLERAKALLPRLVLSDVMMPVMRGDRMVEELRSDPSTANIHCVLMSAAARRGAHEAEILQKPFDLTQIERLVEEVIGPG